MPNDQLADRSKLSLCGIRPCTATSRIICPASLWLQTVFRLPARPYHGTDEGTVGGSIAAGRAPGALSRSPVDCRSIFQMTRPCALAMKRSIKPCLFKAEAHYVVS